MFDFINKTLAENGINPLSNKEKIVSNPSTSKKVVSESSLKEMDMTVLELDRIVEEAIKETANNIIMESVVLEDSEKLRQTNTISNAKIDDEYGAKFIKETVDPIIETVGTLTEDARLLYTVNEPSKVTSVPLPVYEIALTLEAARMGALTEESLDFSKVVKEDVDPTIMDLHGATAEADENKDGKVDENEQKLSDLIDTDESETYDMGEEAVKEGCDPHNVHQYEDNEMYELDKGSEPKQQMFSDDPDFDDESDIETYEGETAGDPTNGGNFPDETMPMSEGAKLARFLFGEDSGTSDVEYVPTSDKDVDTYEGEVAGEEGDGATASDEFEGDGSSDEAIVEEQILIAKYILTQIFKEYGIDSFERQCSMVREAIHYNFKYGSTNLFPATSDVASLVVEQNNISELDGHYSAKQIVDATKVVLTPVQEATIENKSKEYLNALSLSKEMTKDKSMPCEDVKIDDALADGHVNEHAEVMKAINFITKASLIERTRQAFRCRMHCFSEEVKSQVSESWILNESSNEFDFVKKDITIRNYVTEASDLKKNLNILEENSPIYQPNWKKSFIKNDNLTTAVLFTEVAIQWLKLKDELYNQTPLTEKYIALSAMFKLHEVYKNLCNTMKDNSKILNLIEGHKYRLTNLMEKVQYHLNVKK